MASPVVIDDGGSTRIKQLKNNATMDGLMGQDVLGADVFKDNAADPFVDNTGAFRCHMEVRYHDDNDAQHHLVPVGGLDLLISDVVTISSKNGQVAEITFTAAGLLTIELKNAGGAIPIVDSKRDAKRRRYIVTNAGAILRVDVARLGGGIVNPIYNAAVNPSMYTMVFFR